MTAGEVRAEYISTYVHSGWIWTALDTFIQRNEVIYTLSFHALESVWDEYLPGFRSVYESAETQTGYVSNDLTYQYMRRYSDPKGVFTLGIPLSWRVISPEERGDKTNVETIVSPDDEAEIQTAKFGSEVVITPENIGQTAIGLMKDLIVSDIRVTQNEVLQDGRIRLDWTSNSTGKTGFTFFWMQGTDLYLFTFMQVNQHTAIYQKILYQIDDSFQFIADSQ